MLPLALGAADTVGKIAGGLTDSGPSSAAASFRDITGPVLGRMPWTTTEIAIAALAAIAIAGLIALALKQRKG